MTAALALTACQSYTVAPYSPSPDTVRSIKELKLKETISIGEVSVPSNIDLSCRAMGPLAFPNRRSLSEYVKKAMEDELKLADTFAYQNPKVVLTAEITKFEMSSMKNIVKGYFDIDMKVNSSNGKSLRASEYYEFSSGFDGYTACKNTSDALMLATQNLVAKLYMNPNFIDLTKTATTTTTTKDKPKKSSFPPNSPTLQPSPKKLNSGGSEPSI